MKKLKIHILVLGYFAGRQSGKVEGVPVSYAIANDVLSFSPGSIRESVQALAQQGLVNIHGGYGKTSFELTSAGIQWVEDLLFPPVQSASSDTKQTILTAHRLNAKHRKVLSSILQEYQANTLGANVWQIHGELSAQAQRKLLTIPSLLHVAASKINSTYPPILATKNNAEMMLAVKKIEQLAKIINADKNARQRGLNWLKKNVRKSIAEISTLCVLLNRNKSLNPTGFGSLSEQVTLFSSFAKTHITAINK